MPSKPSSRPYAYVTGSVMNLLAMRHDRVARLVRGLLGRHRELVAHVRKYGFCGGPAASMSAARGQTVVAGLERGERCRLVVGEHGFLVVGLGVHPHRRNQQQRLDLVAAQHALLRRRDHTGGHAGLRRTPREPRVAIVLLAVDRRLVDEQRERLHRHIRPHDDDERRVTLGEASRARSSTRLRPDRPSRRAPCSRARRSGPEPAKPSPICIV